MSQKYIISYISLYKVNRSKSNQSKIAPLVQLLTHGHQILIKYWYSFKKKCLLPHIPGLQVCSIFSIVPAPNTTPPIEFCKKHVLGLQNNIKRTF